jgi:hypothetical protein
MSSHWILDGQWHVESIKESTKLEPPYGKLYMVAYFKWAIQENDGMQHHVDGIKT